MNKKTRNFVDSYIWIFISILIISDSARDIKNGEGWINWVMIALGVIVFFSANHQRQKTLE